MNAAKREAIKFSAAENHVGPGSLSVSNARSMGQEAGVRYYGVQINNGDLLNVGINKAGRRATINYVGDGA